MTTLTAMDLGIAETEFAVVDSIDISNLNQSRISFGISAFDKFFGGGLMPGSITTLTAKPGTGKTTLLLQLFESMVLTNTDIKVGYISGEESITQLALNANRIGVKNVKIANMSDIDKICNNILPHFDVIAIDSFQCLTSKLVKGKAKTQLYSIARMVKAAKETQCAIFNICHLTKDGKIKGDSTVIHAVDATFQISKGEYSQTSRIISMDKNRFGPTSDLILEMDSKGYDFDELEG